MADLGAEAKREEVNLEKTDFFIGYMLPGILSIPPLFW
jgi:hypothetical protein